MVKADFKEADVRAVLDKVLAGSRDDLSFRG